VAFPWEIVSGCFHLLRELGTYDFNVKNRWVGNTGNALEVVATLVGCEGDIGRQNFEALESIETLESDGLLEIDFNRLEALDMNIGFALNTNTERLVQENPRVEVVECLVSTNTKCLGDTDIDRASGSLWHGNGCEWGLGHFVLQIHNCVKCIDGCVNGVAASDCGIDFDRDLVALGIIDANAADGQFGIVDLTLDDLWNRYEESVG
jgi:hypothetical protein